MGIGFNGMKATLDDFRLGDLVITKDGISAWDENLLTKLVEA